jgi:hypothetical protein
MRQILRNNDEIRMTKLEGMTNDQVPGDCNIAFPSFGLRAFFVIRYSPAAPKLGEGGCFVISSS